MTFIKFLDDLVRIAYNRSMFIDIDDPLTEITFVAEGHLTRLPANIQPHVKSTLKKGINTLGTGHCFWCGILMTTEDPKLDSFCSYNGTTCKGCAENRLSNRCNGYKKRAKKLKTYSKLTKVDMIKVVMESQGKCKKCGIQCETSVENGQRQKLNDLTLDHDYPLVFGGMNIPQNLVVLCTRCHRNKDRWIANQ